MRLGTEAQGENDNSSVDTLLALQPNGSIGFLKARDCTNKEVGEGCPGKGSQLQDCQERNCPGGWVGNLNLRLSSGYIQFKSFGKDRRKWWFGLSTLLDSAV